MRRPAFALTLAALLISDACAYAHPATPSGAGRTITSNGVTIWYEVRGGGSGTPLILVNGGPGFDHTYELCSDTWDVLGHNRPVVLYDQRGTGRSSPLRTGISCTLMDQIADLDAVREALHARQVVLLGHSWGGYLVMAYTSRHPGNVERLILCDSAAPKWADTEFLFKNFYPAEVEEQARFDLADQLGDSTGFRSSLREYLGWLFVSPARRTEFLAHVDDYHMARAVNAALNADLAQYDFWPAISQFTCPTLVLTGRHDINVAPSTAWKIHRAIPGSRYVVFEESGHLPFFEEPEAFQRTVEGFLAEPWTPLDAPVGPRRTR